MSQFKRLSVLARIVKNGINLCPEYGFLVHGDHVLCPKQINKTTLMKIASRSHIMGSQIRYIREQEEYDPGTHEWGDPTYTGNDWERLPAYKTQSELQFEKFLLQGPDEYEKINPKLGDVRRHCAKNHLSKYLFRGTLDEDNQLGEAPGLPYWVDIPRDGMIMVYTPDPDAIKRATRWHRMGLSWLGKIVYA